MRNNKYSYCNPLPIPDYPVIHEAKTENGDDFRELGDPTVIYHDGKWYMYASSGKVFWTEDLINWKHTPVEPAWVASAPTVLEYKGKFYLTGNDKELYVSDTPLGPFEVLGYFREPSGKIFLTWDPMIFADDDDRVYLYWGSGNIGIYGVELDRNDLTQAITEIKLMFRTDTLNHEWEGGGAFNQDKVHTWTEGPWMYKENGTYYLTYTAPNTEYPSYGMGVYKSDKPLEGYVYAKNNPFLLKRDGIVRGTGHGSIVKGPNGTRWAFYSCTASYHDPYERRVGVDPVGIDENGDLYCKATEQPQMAPGRAANPEDGNGTGDVCLTCFQPRSATSSAPGRTPVYAIDDNPITWWQPADDDKAPALTVDLRGEFTVRSARVIWSDVGLRKEDGIGPGAYGYRIEGKTKDGIVVLADMSDNTDDMVIDYIEIPETDNVSEVTLKITKAPEGITPGVVDFSVFGYMKM
jgi:hypothetical protein